MAIVFRYACYAKFTCPSGYYSSVPNSTYFNYTTSGGCYKVTGCKSPYTYSSSGTTLVATYTPQSFSCYRGSGYYTLTLQSKYMSNVKKFGVVASYDNQSFNSMVTNESEVSKQIPVGTQLTLSAAVGPNCTAKALNIIDYAQHSSGVVKSFGSTSIEYTMPAGTVVVAPNGTCEGISGDDSDDSSSCSMVNFVFSREPSEYTNSTTVATNCENSDCFKAFCQNPGATQMLDAIYFEGTLKVSPNYSTGITGTVPCQPYSTPMWTWSHTKIDGMTITIDRVYAKNGNTEIDLQRGDTFYIGSQCYRMETLSK